MTQPVFTIPGFRAVGAVVVLCTVLSPVVGAAPARAVPVPAAPVALSAAEWEVAGAVHTGLLACELGQSVRVEPDATAPGHFRVQMQRSVYRMRPVESLTGAVRLEDDAQGAVWIQLANKSMLMSQRLGRRLADECAGTQQRSVAQAMKLNPLPSLLDPQ